MQVKPENRKIKILERYPLLKDDTGEELSLTKLALYPRTTCEGFYIKPAVIWIVISKNTTKWGNKAVSYEEAAYWKGTDHELSTWDIEGFTIEEYYAGYHAMFNRSMSNKPSGLKTQFKITYHG